MSIAARNRIQLLALKKSTPRVHSWDKITLERKPLLRRFGFRHLGQTFRDLMPANRLLQVCVILVLQSLGKHDLDKRAEIERLLTSAAAPARGLDEPTSVFEAPILVFLLHR